MNKLFSKIAALSVGLTMAIGVGVAVGSKEAKVAKAEESYTETTFDNLATNDVVVIVGNNGNNYALGNNNGSTSAPSAVAVTVVGTSLSGTIPTTILWKVTKSGTDIEFTVNGGTGKLTCGTANNGMRIDGDGGNSVFSIKDAYIFNSTNSRYVGIYNSQDWRCYTSINSNITGQTFKFFKQGSVGPVVSYTITYNSNGGSGSMSSTTNTVAECGFTAPEGKRFKEWNTAANGSGTTYNPGASAAADLDLFAIWEDKPLAVTLDKIGTSLGSDANTTMETVDILDGSDTYTLNYLQCKKQGDSMFMVKSVSPFISNHTEMPGNITSVEVFINSGASNKTTYDVAFGATEFTTATSGIGAENIAGGSSHIFENGSVEDAKYFCITLGNANNGQVLKVVVNYEESGDPSKDTLVVKLNDDLMSPQTVNYTPVSGWLFYANDKDGNDINSDWESSNESIFTVSKNGNNVAVVTPHDIGTATLTASAEGFNSGSFVLTIVPGTVEEITVTGTMSKTSYYVGDSWSHAGLVATATYDTMYEKDVSEEAVWTYNPASPALSVTSVVATASIGTVSGSSGAQSVTVTRTNPLKALYSKSSGDTIEAYGYYVGFSAADGAYIMDGEYGFLIGDRNLDCSGYTENVTVLHASGKLYLSHGQYKFDYSGLTVTEVTDQSIIDQIEEPVIYAAKGGETVEYESRSTTVTGKVKSVTPKTTAAADYAWDKTEDVTIIMTVGSTDIQVFFKKLNQTAEIGAEIMAALSSQEEITVKGYIAWYDGMQVSMVGVVEAKQDYTAEEFAQDLLDQTDAVCAGWEEGVNNHDALVSIWSNLASDDKYPSLPNDQKTILAGAERDEGGTVIEQAMARYDFLTGKYNLSNFINGRTPIVPAGMMYADNLTTTNSTMVVIVVIASISVLAFTTLLVFKKKKQK